MLSQLDLAGQSAQLKATPQPFLPGDSYSQAAREAFSGGPSAPVANSVGGEPGPLAPIPSTPLPGSSPPAKPPAAPIAELPDRTLAAEPQRDSVASRTLPADPSGIPDDFSEFSGKAPRQAALPKGAKNVQCHSIERDPDTGLVSKVYTYSMESSDGA